MSLAPARKERAEYLANVLSVMDSGRHPSRREAVVLDYIAREIGADKSDLRRARDVLTTSEHRLHMLPDSDARLPNLEHMVMLALADGNVDGHEAEPIEKIARALSYSQIDINMMVRRAKSKLQKLGGSSAQPTRTISRRKRSSTTDVPVARRWKEPSTGSQEQAARAKPKAVPAPVAVTSPPPPEPESDPVPPAEPLPPPVQQAAPNPVEACRKNRQASLNPEEYCFGCGSGRINIWGCRLIGMDWVPGAEWFRSGYFRDDATFVFDKADLVKRVTFGFRACQSCPHIHIEHIETAFELLPSRACTIGRWTHHKAERGDPHAKKVVVKKNLHGCETRQQMLVDGVSPVGTRGALKIIKQAVRKSRVAGLDHKLLEQD